MQVPKTIEELRPKPEPIQEPERKKKKKVVDPVEKKRKEEEQRQIQEKVAAKKVGTQVNRFSPWEKTETAIAVQLLTLLTRKLYAYIASGKSVAVLKKTES